MGREYCSDCDAPEGMWSDCPLANCKMPRVEWVGEDMSTYSERNLLAEKDAEIKNLQDEINGLKLEISVLQESRERLQRNICEFDADMCEAREAAEHALPFVLVQADRWMRDSGGTQFHKNHLDLILKIYKAIRQTPPRHIVEQLAMTLDDDALRAVITEMERLQAEEIEKST